MIKSLLILFILTSITYANDLKVVQFSTFTVQGQVLYINVRESGRRPKLTVQFLGKETPCYKTSNKEWECFIAAPANAPAGNQTLAVLNRGATVAILSTEVLSYPFPVEPLTLSNEKKSLLSRENRPAELKIIRKALKTETKTRAWKPRFIQPIDGVIESLYGEKRILDGKLREGYHRGLDLGAPEGTPIKAANHGKVILAGPFTEEGNMVMIDHGQGFITAYLHLSKTLIRKGNRVKKGVVIGEVGSTGVASTPHLHFGAYIHGTPIDPLHLLEFY